ncbi:MAG: helix-turn-helix domain-containing protein [Clostridia bacterium]|nr:helix-turn-helix domain-containing protein [Clostridia bacterium]
MIRFGITPHPIESCRAHSHDNWEIVCYLEGNGWLRIGDYPLIEFEPGVIVCQPPGIPHSEWAEGNFQDMYLVTDEFLPPVTDRPTVYRDSMDGDFRQLMMLGLRQSASDRAESRRIAENTVKILFDLLKLWEESRAPDFVDRLERLLLAEYADPSFDLGATIDGLGYNRDYVRRCFIARCGKTPLEYLTGLRVGHARLMLERHNQEALPIREIARLSGFADEFYFSRVYRKVTGESPSATRSRNCP